MYIDQIFIDFIKYLFNENRQRIDNLFFKISGNHACMRKCHVLIPLKPSGADV